MISITGAMNAKLVMLLADYKNKHDYANRKDLEAERARAAADEALAKLVSESRKQGITIGV